MVTPFPASTSAPRRDRAVGVALHSLEGRHRLEISGPLPPGWIAALSHGLARHGLSIRRARGRRDARGHWEASISFTAGAGVEVSGLDFRSLLTRTAGARSQAPVALDGYSFVGPTAEGSIVLSITGRDRVGFLASLLDSLALYSLFPQDLAIETEGTVVRDRFVLRGLAGRRPSSEACDAVRRTLDTLVARDTATDTNVASEGRLALGA